MKRHWSALLLVLATLAVLVFPQGCSKKAVEAKIVAFKGNVLVNGKAAVQGAFLLGGAVLTVPQKGFVRLSFNDGSKQFLFAHPKTKAPLTYTLVGRKGQGDAETMFCNLASGVVAFFVPKGRTKKMRFQIQAEHTITAIRGTEGRVMTTASGDDVGLKTGVVDVTHLKSNKTMTLKAGQKLEAAPDGSMTGPFGYDFSNANERAIYLEKLPDLMTF